MRRALLHARLTAGATLGDVLAVHLDCLADREQEVRWLVLESPTLPKGFHTAWLGLQSAASSYICQAAERDMATGTIRQMPLHLLYNTWIGLVHHYVINRELFAPGKTCYGSTGVRCSIIFPPWSRTGARVRRGRHR